MGHHRQGRRGVPVVHVHDVGPKLVGQRGHRRREREEPLVVVRPAGAVGLDVGVGPLDPWRRHQAQLAHRGMHPPTDRDRPGPRGPVDGLKALVGQEDTAVVGQQQGDLDALPAQLGHQAGSGRGQPSHRGDASQLSGGEQHVHARMLARAGGPCRRVAGRGPHRTAALAGRWRGGDRAGRRHGLRRTGGACR